MMKNPLCMIVILLNTEREGCRFLSLIPLEYIFNRRKSKRIRVCVVLFLYRQIWSLNYVQFGQVNFSSIILLEDPLRKSGCTLHSLSHSALHRQSPSSVRLSERAFFSLSLTVLYITSESANINSTFEYFHINEMTVSAVSIHMRNNPPIEGIIVMTSCFSRIIMRNNDVIGIAVSREIIRAGSYWR